MITDYSSVFFDFSYMRKPVIFYQFDEKKFRKAQYAEGYFSYKNTIRAITLGCDLPKQLEPLRQLENHQLQERYDCIVNIYKQMEEIEQELNN